MTTDSDSQTSASETVRKRILTAEGTGLRTFMAGDPIVRARTTGSTVLDADGNEYLDMHAGFAVASVGYCHPRVTAAIQAQAEIMTHCPSASPSEMRADFYERLIAITPPGLDRALLSITGAAANETAVQIARCATGRDTVIAFSGGYFGRTTGSVGFAGKHRYRSALGLPGDAQFLPYPDPDRSPWAAEGEPGELVLGLLEEMLTDPASGVSPPACILVEPIQGNGGIVIPPPGFLAGLRRLATASGAMLIFDEIQCGFGRAGRWWACEHEAVTPDLLTIGKGIGGGLPISAVVGTRDAMTALPPDAVTSTFLANALTQAAAIATIDVMHDEGLVERSAVLGRLALDRLSAVLSGVPSAGAVRGRGLFIGIEMVSQAGPDAAAADAVIGRLRDRNIIVGRGGRFDNVVKLSPPLTIPEPDLTRALDLIAEAIA